ncbi:helix-turn-helix transcriptional regulator [Terrimonas rubra]|uniref:Helix-turn-helix transcriptional regulator n=1 Tax=Terrimonas rubra TaxID=1035890 RepID=A0ABW5ZZT5_9BACT
MEQNDTKRLSRLTAILTLLQTKSLLTSTELAKKFGVSIRTIYRDIRALESSGVPILTEEGKGYSLMEGYKVPPVMFTEAEANALITAEKLVLRNKDESFVKNYSDAINKIKSVLRYNTQNKVNFLSSRISFWRDPNQGSTNYLSTIQVALTDYRLVKIQYTTPDKNECTERLIEPFALYNTKENWVLIAWCRLRKDYREFRLDRISQLITQDETFKPHALTLSEYYTQRMEGHEKYNEWLQRTNSLVNNA